MQQQEIYINRLRAQVLNFENSRLSFREARQERLDAENRVVSVTNLAEELEMELATAQRQVAKALSECVMDAVSSTTV